MKIIAHRKNTLAELKATPLQYGVEIDIRSFKDQLILQHEPYVEGELLADWLQAYKHGTLILNVKEEGLEARLIEMMRSYQIDDYFFLDQSFPFLVKWANAGESHCAVRVSEFESIQTALTLAGKIDWVWVDCFNRLALQKEEAKALKEAGFKLCLVSPELQGRRQPQDIAQIQAELKSRNIVIDAVCTKFPELWNKITNE
ncbi:MAG TPA: phosphatidylinositol-specific phospholipase C/glycerophosphodiester phosphodiesterase family protein [Gammaproteobacteria bacterium]|nr:phosphatidylinositol-specific phospholipase C/glycerophosphodiester phosphodiesterase family protein [Gammaproteobacteria bacterium]